MTFMVKGSDVINKKKGSCLIVALFSNRKLGGELQALDRAFGGVISALIKQSDKNSKLGETNLLYQLQNSKVTMLLVVGAGNEIEFDNKATKKWLNAVLNVLKNKLITDVCFLYGTIKSNRQNTYYFGRLLPLVIEQVSYQFNQFKSKLNESPYQLKTCTLITDVHEERTVLKIGLRHGCMIADAITATKDLANMPPNICDANYLAKQSQLLARQYPNVKTTVLNGNDLAQLGMNAYLAVGSGSNNESKLVILEYKGAKDKLARPVVLVGKGVTFDSGGISIKPATAMDEMKYDMCGAATVYGVVQAVANLALPLNIVGIIAGCENMPSSSAYRPGDILTTLSGKSVEIINTDAEGRLILCDVLTYASRFDPVHVIDIATLTGACVIALGHHYTGLIANDDKLANALLVASQRSGDKVWRLPIDDEFQRQIESPFADMMNAAGKEGGAITAGCFLSRFTENYSWAHLDIAGTAWKTGPKKGATGRPVELLVQFMLDLANIS